MISGLIYAKLNLLREEIQFLSPKPLQKEPFSPDKENKAVQNSHFLVSGGPRGTGGDRPQAYGNSRLSHKVLDLFLGQNWRQGPRGPGVREPAAWGAGAPCLLYDGVP